MLIIRDDAVSLVYFKFGISNDEENKNNQYWEREAEFCLGGNPVGMMQASIRYGREEMANHTIPATPNHMKIKIPS